MSQLHFYLYETIATKWFLGEQPDKVLSRGRRRGDPGPEEITSCSCPLSPQHRLARTFRALRFAWSRAKNGVRMQKIWPVKVCCPKTARFGPDQCKRVKPDLDADLPFSFFGIFFLDFFYNGGGKKAAARVYGSGGRRWWLGLMTVADGDLQAAKQCGGGVTNVTRTRNSKGNQTLRPARDTTMQTKNQKAKTVKIMQWLNRGYGTVIQT